MTHRFEIKPFYFEVEESGDDWKLCGMLGGQIWFDQRISGTIDEVKTACKSHVKRLLTRWLGDIE